MLQIDMSGKLAVVTGGGRSIGRATADLLARCGAQVTKLEAPWGQVFTADQAVECPST